MTDKISHVEISIPPYFVCPISLELMRDPVTLSTGQTFDRCSIEKWLDEGRNSCPVTRQTLQADEELIPNHVLRRMIQGWCVANRSMGIERISTPRQPATLEEIYQMVHEASPRNVDMDTLQRLNRIARDHPRTRKRMLQAGVLSFLASSLTHSLECSSSVCSRNDCFTPRMLDKAGETLKLLALLCETEGAIMFWDPTIEQLSDIAWLLVKGRTLDARLNAAVILSSKQISEEMKKKVGAIEGLMGGILQLITDALHPKASSIGLMLLLQLCSSIRNQTIAAEAGVVDALVELLPGTDRRTTELGLAVLEALCSNCADGRAAFSSNASSSIPMIVKLMGSVSERATKYAVRILWVVLRSSSGTKVKKTAVKAGAFTKLVVLAQSGASRSTKLSAQKSLRALSEVMDSKYRDPNYEISFR